MNTANQSTTHNLTTPDEGKIPAGSRPAGIATVNNSDNPTPQEREAALASEPDTERIRTERKSVEDGAGSNS